MLKGQPSAFEAAARSKKSLADICHRDGAFSTWTAARVPRVVRCKGCGSSHREGAACEYCGVGE